MNILDQVPPHDPRAERGLCACAIIKPDIIGDIGRIVRADNFHLEACRAVWAVVAEAFEQGKRIDAVLLRSRLKANGSEVDDEMLAKIIGSEVTPVMAGKYAEIIAEKAARRRLALAASAAVCSAYDDTTPLNEVLAAVERLLSEEARPEAGTIDNRAGLMTAIEEIDSATGSAIPTGFSGLDAAYGGLFPGELLILAGRTGSGKSAFALQVAEHVARKKPILYCSLEMGATEIHRRRIARMSGVSLRALRSGDLTEGDRRRIIDSTLSLEAVGLHVLDAANCGLTEISRESRRLKHREGLGLIVVDYLQLLRSDAGDSRANRERQIAGLTRGLKCLARDLEVPVLCLCQLNRKADDADEPRLSHLRESGAIEQDADAVLFVDRTEDHDGDATRLIVAKHRNGRPQAFPLIWDGPRMTFSEPDTGGKIEADDHDFAGTSDQDLPAF
jgi:replicative DNA helicase